MKPIDKFKQFISDLSQNHSNKVFFEGVSNAINVIFESATPSALTKIVSYIDDDRVRELLKKDVATLNRLKIAINNLEIKKLSKAEKLDYFVKMIYSDFSKALDKLNSNDFDDATNILDGLAHALEVLGELSTDKIKAVNISSMLDLPTASDMTARDIAAGEAGLGYGGSKIAAGTWKGMVGDSFVGHVGTTKAKRIGEHMIAALDAGDKQTFDELQAMQELVFKYEPAIAENIRPSTLIAYEDIFTRGQKADDFGFVEKVAEKTGVDTVTAVEEKDPKSYNGFVNELILEGGYELAEAERIYNKYKAWGRNIRAKFFDYLYKTFAAPVNRELYDKLQDAGVGDLWPYPLAERNIYTGQGSGAGQGKGANKGTVAKHQQLAGNVYGYFHPNVRNPSVYSEATIKQIEEALSKIDMTLEDVYKMLTQSIKGDNKDKVLRDIKSRLLGDEKSAVYGLKPYTKQGSPLSLGKLDKEIINDIDADDESFTDFDVAI